MKRIRLTALLLMTITLCLLTALIFAACTPTEVPDETDPDTTEAATPAPEDPTEKETEVIYLLYVFGLEILSYCQSVIALLLFA